MKLEDLKVYSKSMDLGERVWSYVSKWAFFEKDTIGKQLVRSVDSVAANLSEGFGRYHYKDAKRFYYFSRGSLYETKTWLTKAHSRGLIPEEELKILIDEVDLIGRMLNSYISSIGRNSVENKPTAKEPFEEYGDLTNDQ